MIAQEAPLLVAKHERAIEEEGDHLIRNWAKYYPSQRDLLQRFESRWYRRTKLSVSIGVLQIEIVQVGWSDHGKRIGFSLTEDEIGVQDPVQPFLSQKLRPEVMLESVRGRIRRAIESLSWQAEEFPELDAARRATRGPLVTTL